MPCLKILRIFKKFYAELLRYSMEYSTKFPRKVQLPIKNNSLPKKI